MQVRRARRAAGSSCQPAPAATERAHAPQHAAADAATCPTRTPAPPAPSRQQAAARRPGRTGVTVGVQRDGLACLAGAPRAADAMHIVHGRLREVEIHHRAHADKVHAARDQVCAPILVQE